MLDRSDEQEGNLELRMLPIQNVLFFYSNGTCGSLVNIKFICMWKLKSQNIKLYL